jgi:glutaminyl-tRNA synthetase
VCSLDAATAAAQRGNLTSAGQPSPYRSRSVQDNLRLFDEMWRGLHPDGAHVLRAKIDMGACNLRMRDPVMYRIRHEPPHPRAASIGKWCIYPTYDFAHCMSDAIEGVTHSLCTLEFVEHRELYDWFVRHCFTGISDQGVGGAVPPPRQIEYGRLNMAFTVTSKRKLRLLVDSGRVDGWDDPRLPTLAALRRRGYPPAAIRLFCARVGVARTANALVDPSMLEACVRDSLDSPVEGHPAPRAMVVARPLRVIIETIQEGATQELKLPRHPNVTEMGTRTVPLTREIYIDRQDFLEPGQTPPPKYKRLALDQHVRLRGSYVIRCVGVERGADGGVVALRCTHDPATLGKKPVGYKANGVLHWVSAEHGVPVQLRQYGRLFQVADPLDHAATSGQPGDEAGAIGHIFQPSSSDLRFLDHYNPVIKTPSHTPSLPPLFCRSLFAWCRIHCKSLMVWVSHRYWRRHSSRPASSLKGKATIALTWAQLSKHVSITVTLEQCSTSLWAYEALRDNST